MTDVALNPFPGRPIRADLPPELPTLQATHRLDTPDGPRLRVQWPDGFPGVRLQRTTNLDTPVAWQELAVASNDVLLPAPEEGAVYFRLV